MRKTLFVLIIALAVFNFTAGAFCAQQDQAPQFYKCEAADISGDRYLPAVKAALSKAEKSIDMAMYLASYDPTKKNSPVTELAEELIKAHERGVKVKVILDQNIYFSQAAEMGGQAKRDDRNDAFFVYLKKNGIETFYDNIYTVTHSKLIVIDDETVIVGSTNWTNSALSRNQEATCLIKSKELAGQYLADISRIKVSAEP